MKCYKNNKINGKKWVIKKGNIKGEQMKNLIIDIKNWIEWKKFINKYRYLELTERKRTKENTDKLLRREYGRKIHRSNR